MIHSSILVSMFLSSTLFAFRDCFLSSSTATSGVRRGHNIGFVRLVRLGDVRDGPVLGPPPADVIHDDLGVGLGPGSASIEFLLPFNRPIARQKQSIPL